MYASFGQRGGEALRRVLQTVKFKEMENKNFEVTLVTERLRNLRQSNRHKRKGD